MIKNLQVDSPPCSKFLLEFRPSNIHGTGGFATQQIRKGRRIIEYFGEKIDKRESLRLCEQNNAFIFYLDEEFDLNGDVSWNPARFLNHSCEPNSEAIRDDGHVWMVALRSIAAGEEITLNYCYDLEDYANYPCLCGSPSCVGYMVAEEFFPTIRRRDPDCSTPATS